MKVLIFILSLFLSVNGLSQIDSLGQRFVNSETFIEKQAELEYDKTKKGLVLRDRWYPKPEEVKPKTSLGPFGILMRILTQGFAYIIVILLLSIIVYLIFSNIKIDKKIEKDLDFIDEVENIEEIDAEALYKQAKADGNYPLAIRLQFISILQILSAREHIYWEKEKTNRDYYREIEDRNTKTGFRTNANIFERVWYGDQEIDLNSIY